MQIYHRRGMGQFRNAPLWSLTLVIAALTSCEKKEPPGVSAPDAKHPTVASLVPAATDLILAMGLGNHLLAVSNFEPSRDPTRNLPRVGDYQTTDWERLRALHPDLMIVQIAPDRLPAGLVQRAQEMNIRLVNVKLD